MSGAPGAWLAIDTATDIASVALGRPPATLAGAHVEGARRHAAELIRLVDFVLRRAGVHPRELEGIVVADGPGSFTGLRIGWAAAKGLAHEPGLELRAIPSLMAAACAGAMQRDAEPVAACYDALRGEVYGAVYAFHPDHVDTIVAPGVLTPKELARVTPVRPAVVVGSGVGGYAAELTGWAGVPPVPLESLPPTATMLLALLGRVGADRALDDAATAEPVYGRPAEAQAKWEARHGRPIPDQTGHHR